MCLEKIFKLTLFEFVVFLFLLLVGLFDDALLLFFLFVFLRRLSREFIIWVTLNVDTSFDANLFANSVNTFAVSCCIGFDGLTL